MLRAQRPGHLGHGVTHRTANGGCEHGFARHKSCRAQGNERCQVRDRNTRGGVINVLGNQAQMLLLHRDPFTERAILGDTVRPREHDSGTIRKPVVSARLDNARPFVAQHERRFCPWMASGKNGVIERGDSGCCDSHQDASIRHRWLGDIYRFQILIAAEPLCHYRTHLPIPSELLKQNQLGPAIWALCARPLPSETFSPAISYSMTTKSAGAILTTATTFSLRDFRSANLVSFGRPVMNVSSSRIISSEYSCPTNDGVWR